MAGNEPILSLDVFAPERPKVSINKKPYEMKLPEEFSLRERALLQKHARAINAMLRPDATDLELAEGEQALDVAFRMAYPDVPDTVVEQIMPYHRQVFVDAFYERFLTPTAISRPEPTPEETARQATQTLARLRGARPTGGTSSPTSAPSTATQAA